MEPDDEPIGLAADSGARAAPPARACTPRATVVYDPLDGARRRHRRGPARWPWTPAEEFRAGQELQTAIDLITTGTTEFKFKVRVVREGRRGLLDLVSERVTPLPAGAPAGTG